MDTLIRRFAARLYSLRTERNLSQEALAARADLHQTFVSQIENSRQEPGLSTIGKLAKGLGLEPQDLLAFPDSGGQKVDRIKEELALLNRRLKGCDLALVRKARKIIEVLAANT